MSVARITEISAESARNFDDAVRQGIRRANETLRNVKGAWIKEQQITVADGKITTYRVNMLVTFVLEDVTPVGRRAAAAAAAPAPAPKAPARKPAARRTTARRATARRRR